MSNQNPLKVFISYAPGDHELMLEFARFLTPLTRNKSIVVWHQGEILGGRSREDAIYEQLQTIDIFLPLLSAEYYADENIWKNELMPAFKRRDSGKCEVTPVWLRSFVLPNDLSDLVVLPKDEHGRPKAITSWDKDKKDDAFSAAVRGLLQVIGALKEGKAAMGPSGTAAALSLANVWGQFPLKKGIPRLKILQLNRALAFGKAVKPFATSENFRDKNLFFFIAACKTQNPDNIVNRLFYYCEDTFDKYDCDNNDTLDNVPVHDFEIKITPKSTWDYFWNHFKNKLRDFKAAGTQGMPGGGELSFEEFATLAPELLRQTKRIPFVCRIPENEWENTLDATGHLKYLIEQFSGIPRSANKFVFFFLLELDDLHNCHCHAESKVAARFKAVKQLCAESFDTAHMELVELMDHATAYDVRSWLSGLIDDKSGTRTLDDYFNLLLDCLLRELNPIEKELYQRKKAFNMDRLVIMQRHAYLYLK